MVRSIYCRKAKEKWVLTLSTELRTSQKDSGGGVATIIACSKPAALERYATADSSGNYFGTWFRLYSDGWCEQGIITRDYWDNNSAENAGVLFPLPFKDTNFTTQITYGYKGSGDSSYGSYGATYRHRTTQSICPNIAADVGVSSGTEVHIHLCGFVSQETINNVLSGKVWVDTTGYNTPGWIDDPNA